MFTLFSLAFLVGCILGIYDIIQDYRSKKEVQEVQEKPLEMPYYIDEQIEAILQQIEACHSLIDRYTDSLNYMQDLEKIATLKKKRADALYKSAKLEEKLQKLLEKWEE